MSLLAQVAPVLLRHLGAYAELLAQDLARSREGFTRRLSVMLIAGLGLTGAVVMLCVAIVAETWDTIHRMTAVYSLLTFFVALAGLAAAYAVRLQSRQTPLFAGLQREWRLDQVLVDRVISENDENRN